MDDKIDEKQTLQYEHFRLRQFLNECYESSKLENHEQIIEKIKVIEKFYLNKNKIIFLWDHRKFLPLYVSESAISFGYSPQEIYDMSLWQVMQRVYWRKLPLVFKYHRDMERFRKITAPNSIKNHEIYFCGIKLKNKWGKLRSFFVMQKFLSATKEREPLISFIEVEDITYLHKSDVGWLRMVDRTRAIPIVRAFAPYSSSKISAELLSDRELAILRLINENNDSAIIAEILNISPETVKKHRKNMLAKTGLKDMTALIYISKQCNLV